jgi:hypothetical protein
MSKSKIKPQDNAANIGNRNAGSPGTNRQYDQNQGNRGKQLDPKQGAADVRSEPQRKGSETK